MEAGLLGSFCRLVERRVDEVRPLGLSEVLRVCLCLALRRPGFAPSCEFGAGAGAGAEVLVVVRIRGGEGKAVEVCLCLGLRSPGFVPSRVMLA